MSKRKIFINISDVASFIGQNKWDYVTPFERLWKKCDADSYEKILNDVSSQIEEKRLESQVIDQDLQNLKDDLDAKRITQRQYTLRRNKLEKQKEELQTKLQDKSERVDDIQLTQAQKLEKLVGTELITKMGSNTIETEDKRKVLDQAIQSLNLSKEKKDAILKQGESFLNKTHGTLKEDSAIGMYEEKFHVKLDTSQKFNKMHLIEASTESVFDWYICGKVDGLYICESNSSNSYIVEVKNRTKSFFNSLRDYEKTQIHLYMRMLQIPKAKLVEKYGAKIRVTEIYEDKQYSDDIIEYLGVFIKSFETKFLENASVKASYIEMSGDDKKRFVQTKMLNSVQNHINKKIKEQVGDDSDDADADCMIDDLD